MSLRIRLAVFALLVMTIVASERTYSIVRLHMDNLAAAENHVTDLLERGVSQFSAAVSSAHAVLSTLAATPGTVPADNALYTATPSDQTPSVPDPGMTPDAPSHCQALRPVLESSPSIASLTIVAPNGIVRCGTANGAVGLDLSTRDYFRIAMRGIPSLESVSVSYVTGTPSLYAAQPVIGENGDVVAVLVARIELSDLLPREFLSDLGPTAQVIIVDPAGALVMTYPDGLPVAARMDLSDTAPVALAMSRTRGTILAEGPDGVRLYAFTRLPATNLHLLVGVDEAIILKPVERATWSAGLMLLVLSGIILCTFWLAGERLIVAPVQALANRLVRFGRGETEEAPTAHLLITELQPLVVAFEHMTGELTRRESALRNANRRLNSLASLDPLTGIANRRSFDAALALQWNTATRLGMLMIDIDKFKAFNDHHGHQEGDHCIRLVAQTMASTIRSSDMVARVGGEEFAVLMPGATLAAAVEVGQRLRRAIESLAIEHPTGVTGVVTVSIGCAACDPGPALAVGDLVAAADKALYEAKAAGRNEVRSAKTVGAGAGSADGAADGTRRAAEG